MNNWPTQKDLEEMRKLLEKVEPSQSLPENPSKTEYLKYKLCEEFVKYLLETGETQKNLAHKLEIDPARLNDIVKYKIDLFTVDRLLNYVEKLRPEIRIEVA